MCVLSVFPATAAAGRCSLFLCVCGGAANLLQVMLTN